MRFAPLAALLPAVLAGGCATNGTPTVNRGIESVHQPIVQQQDYAFDVNAGPRGLTPGEQQRLADWLNSLGVGYGDRIAIDDPAHGAATRRDVTRLVAGHGLLVSRDVPVIGAPVAPGTARVIISRMIASVPGCPDWSRPGSHEFAGNTTSNYGCAANSNLAAMVANPFDLVRGQTGSDTVDVASAVKPIDAFRKATPTGGGGTVIKQESSKGGSN